MEEIPQIKESKKLPGKKEAKAQRFTQGPEETEALYSGARATIGTRGI